MADLQTLRKYIRERLQDYGQTAKFAPIEITDVVNTVLRDFVSKTGILHTSTSVALTSGAGTVTSIEGPILRVETAGGVALTPTTPGQLDVLIGDWRAVTTGTPTYWMRHRGSYSQIQTYPLTSSVNVTVYHAKSPTALSADNSTPEIPTQYHDALTWGSVAVLLDSVGDQKAELARARYQEFTELAKADVAASWGE